MIASRQLDVSLYVAGLLDGIAFEPERVRVDEYVASLLDEAEEMASLCQANSKPAAIGTRINVSEEDENDLEEDSTRFIDELLARVAFARQ